MSLVDEVGIEVAASVGKNLAGDLGVRVGAGDAAFFDEVIANNWLGRKTGKGMFVYEGKKKEVNEEMVKLLESYQAKRPQESDNVGPSCSVNRSLSSKINRSFVVFFRRLQTFSFE